MDQRERTDDQTEALRAALDGRQTTMWTAIPAIIDSFNPQAMTVVAQPSIQGRQSATDGSVKFVNLPQLLDVPVVFPGGGGLTLTFPVQTGDEALIVFASRCIDAWFQSGGVQPQAEARMHDLSDGFALVGVRSQPRALTNLSTSSAQIRTDDGTLYIDLNASSKALTLTAPGGLVVNGNVQLNGAMTATGDVIGNGISLDHHVHTGVQTGTSSTGAATG